MIELAQLEQLAAFAEYGTLSKAAEKLHMSQPTLTRAMQKLESAFGVPLFLRTKNRLELNENGKLAADYAARILRQTQDMVQLVRAFDRANHTLSIGACAPMPLLSMVQAAARAYPDMAVTSELKDCGLLLEGLRNGIYQAVILPFRPEDGDFFWKKCGTESISLCLPEGHPFAKRTGVHLREMDGENFLLAADIGFWHDLVTREMPHTRFLVQNERFALDELVQASVLPSFVSDLILNQSPAPKGRVVVPILDEGATAEYYAVCRKEDRERLRYLF